MEEQLSFFEKNPKKVMLSLQEDYYKQMLEGRKKYEYRTRYIKEESVAYIYISRTLKKIVAKIEFGKPIIGIAKDIAMISETENPGSYDSIIEYMHNGIGYAIPINKIIPIKEITLEEIKDSLPDFVPPQSYYILDNNVELLELLEKSQIEEGKNEKESEHIKRNYKR